MLRGAIHRESIVIGSTTYNYLVKKFQQKGIMVGIRKFIGKTEKPSEELPSFIADYWERQAKK
jgi:hypothetical protein